MLLQRLIADPKCGFNYDYMGSAEYEFGATTLARTDFARQYLAGNIAAKCMTFVEQVNRFNGNGHARAGIDVVVYSTKEVIEGFGDELTIQVTKETFRTDNPNILGWMKVAGPRSTPPAPLFIVRANVDRKRVDQFFQPPIDYLEGGKARRAGEELDSSKSKEYQAGWEDFTE